MEYRQALAAGTLLASEYRISSTLRQDGFCITYDAEDLQLKSHVLIKEYFPAEIADRFNLTTVRPKSTRQVGVLSWGRQRFIEEAQTLTKFSHPGIARVKRVFEENNTAYCVVDAEDWPTLLSWADKQRRQLNQNELDQVAKQLLDSLDLLHDANVLVRDLSPESIYIRDKRQLVLIDFGTAKSQLAARARKMHAVVRPGYSAPEQYLFDADQQGPWTDIFSLGAVLYRLFTGRSPVEVIHRHHTDDMATAASLHTKGYRLEFLQAIDRAMSLAASDRPQTAKAFRALLLEGSKGASPAKSPEAPAAKPAEPVAEPPRPAPASPAQQSPAEVPAAPIRQSEPTIVAPPHRPQAETGAPTAAGTPPAGAGGRADAGRPAPTQASPPPQGSAPSELQPPSAGTANGSATGTPARSSAPASPRIPAGMVPSALLSDKAADEDKLGFSLPEAEPDPEPEAAKAPAGTKTASEKESPVKSDPARGSEIDALAVSNRRFMIAVVGIIGALIGIIGLGLVTLERTLRQPTQHAQAEHTLPQVAQPAQSEQDRQRAEQKAIFEDAERKRRESEKAVEQRRAAEAEQKRKDEETARQRKLAEEAADKKRKEDEAAEQKRKAAEAAKQKQLADAAAEKKRAEEAARQKAAEEAAEKKRQEETARQQRIAEEAAEKKRRDDEAARQQKVAEAAAEQKRRDEEAARQKLAAEESARKKRADEEAAAAKRKAEETAQQKRLADTETKRADGADQRRLAEEAIRQKQLADEVERRRQEEASRLELKRLAEEAERRRREQAQKDAVDRQQADRQRQAEEAQRIAERQRADADRQLLAQVASESSREQLLKIASLNPQRRELVDRRLVELGYLRVAATAGELWRKPGAGEAFQDCPTCPALVVVPAGQFLMGSPQNEANRQDDEDDTPGPGGSQIRVTIQKPFAVTKLEITRAQFAAFIAETKYKIEGGCFVRVDAFELFPDYSWQSPGFKQTDEHPAACVSWLDARAYAAWLSKKTGHTYRLLTETEWEYAARGAPGPTVQPRFPFGTSDKDLCAFGNGADQAAKKVYDRWQVANCNDGYDHTAPGGSFEPNATGVHDMLGNLWEWVEDCYRDSLKGQPRKAESGETCSQDLRVLRGGSWSDPPDKLRPAARIAIPADKRIQIGGFRLARDL